MRIYLGIDIGTSKICVSALDGNSRKLVDTVSERNSSNIKTKKGFFEQNPEKIKKITFQLFRKIKKRIKGKIAGIGFTGQMHGMLFVDRNLKPLSNLIVWQDKRSESLIPEIYNRIRNTKSYECGCLIRPGYMGASLYWFYKHKLVPKNVYKVCFIQDWIASCLTEEKTIFTDPTDAASSGIFNIKKAEWHWKIIEKLGIKKEILPEVKNSGETIGFTKEGIPVGCAVGDNQASVFGGISGHKESECINLNIGTGAQISVVIDSFSRIKGNLELRPYFNGKYIIAGASLNGGAVYSVLKDFFVSAGMISRKIKQNEIFEKMNKLASAVPHGCSGLTCYPYFFGERGKEKLQASFTGLNIHNFTPGHLCRAILEGMVRILYEYYKEMGKKRKCIIGSGNAIKRNETLQEITKQIFKMNLKLSSYREEAAYGAALLIADKLCL